MRLAATSLTLRCIVVAFAVLVGATPIGAQEKFPAKPVRIVVGSEPGSAPDILARVVANEMGPLLGQPIIVENRAGAAGTIGAATVVAAKADGYTLLMGTVSNVALAPSFYPVKYDPEQSFTPIGMVAAVPLVLVASPALGAQTFAELQAKVRQSGPGEQIAYSSPGVGGPQHLAGVLLQRYFDRQWLHVPYKSGGAAMASVAAGDTRLAFAGIPAAGSLAQAQKVVPLFVTAPRRSSAMPNVPSSTEVGLADFDIDNWHALLGPAGMPAPVQASLEAALVKVLAAAAVREQFLKVGAEPAPSSGKALARVIAAETSRWSRIVKENNLKVD
jgi:tripartite-type tricarboxylate transporter receptor subunit TctC